MVIIIECNAREKAVMLNALEDEVVSFTLELSSPCVMRSTNHLTLNHPKDLRLHAHLIKCEEHLKKVLNISNLCEIDWSLLAHIAKITPKFLHL